MTGPATAPEALRALSYLRRHGTESSHARIRARFAQTIEAVAATLADIGEDAARTRPPSGGWCVQEIADHLAVTNRAAVAEFGALVAGRVPDDGPIPAGLQSPDPLASSWADVVARLKAADAALFAVLDTATDATPVTARAPLVMVVKAAGAGAEGEIRILEWVEPLDWKAYCTAFRAHGLEHIAQVERVLAAVSSRH